MILITNNQGHHSNQCHRALALVNFLVLKFQMSRKSRKSPILQFLDQKVSKWHWLIFTLFGALANNAWYCLCCMITLKAFYHFYFIPRALGQYLTLISKTIDFGHCNTLRLSGTYYLDFGAQLKCFHFASIST